jgi:prepilin-type N-terminal cleavage/methylation domain-containing protein
VPINNTAIILKKSKAMFNSKENGFSLVELIVVLIITAILAQLGFTAFNRYARRTRAFAAKTALKNIQRECESNRDLEAPETFTLLPIKGYSISTRDTNSCYGQSSDGKVAAIADNQDEIPNYFYDFLLGQISCSFSGNLFQECNQNAENSQNSQNSKLISSPKAIKNDCIDGQETGLKMYSYGPDSVWSHDCKFTDVNSLIGSGTISTDSGSINLSEKGEITMGGSYSRLNSIQEKELKKGGFKQIFAGGYGSYAAMREDGSMVVLGMNSQDDINTINTLINPPSEIRDIQFNYGGGAVKLIDGQILTWGNGGGYADELRYRLNR